jgi:hypothetical protein
MVTYVFAAIVAYVFTQIAQDLLAEDPQQPLIDKKPATISDQASFVPRVYGIRRVGANIGAIWGRVVDDESLGSGGKGAIGGSSPKQQVYYENGWHRLCIHGGESTRLTHIYSNGERIWFGQLSYWPSIPGSHDPSGTEIDLGSEGSFRVYWGMNDDPIDADLREAVSISSRWPTVISIIWIQKRLGGFAVWPLLEYVVQVHPLNQTVFPSSDHETRSGIGFTNATPVIHAINNHSVPGQSPYPYITVHNNATGSTWNYLQNAEYLQVRGQPIIADGAVYEVSQSQPPILITGTFYELDDPTVAYPATPTVDADLASYAIFEGTGFRVRAILGLGGGGLVDHPSDAPHGNDHDTPIPVYYRFETDPGGPAITGPWRIKDNHSGAAINFVNGRQTFDGWVRGFGTSAGEMRQFRVTILGLASHSCDFVWDGNSMAVIDREGAHGNIINVGRGANEDYDWWHISVEYMTGAGVSPSTSLTGRSLNFKVYAVDDDYTTLADDAKVAVYLDANWAFSTNQAFFEEETGVANTNGVIRVYLDEPLFSAKSGYGEGRGGIEGVGTGVSIGMNLGYILYELMFEPWPYGIGLNQDEWEVFDTGGVDENSLEAIAVLSEQGNDGICINLFVQFGGSYKATLNALLMEHGIVITMNSLTGKYGFKPIRSGETPKVIPLDGQARIVREGKRHLVEQSTVVVGSFSDWQINFKTSTFLIANDTHAECCTSAIKQQVIPLETVTDRFSATKALSRLAAISTTEATSRKIELLRGGRNLLIGDLIQLTGSDEELRILGKQVDVNSTISTIDAIVDIYNDEDEPSLHPLTVDNGEDDNDPPILDLASTLYESENVSTPESMTVAVLRIRGDARQREATALISNDNSTFEDIQATLCAGGTLVRDLSSTGRHRITATDNIYFKPLGPDLLSMVQTLSDAMFASGGQQMVIGTELFYLQGIVAVGEGVYKFSNCLRARRGTVRENHTYGDTLYIFRESAIAKVPHPLLNPGKIYYKTRPYSVDPSTVASQNQTLTGKAIRPQPVFNFRTSAYGGQFVYFTGDNITLKWNYLHPLSRKARTGAGFQGYGEKAGISDLHDAFFRIHIEIFGEPDVNYTTTDKTIDFTNADLIAWNGGSGEPALITMTVYFTYRQIESALTSASCFLKVAP